MGGVKIRQAERSGPPDPIWRKGRPKSRALVASQSGVNLVLTAIGQEVEYMEGIESLDEWFRGFEFEEGVWDVEFWLWSGSYETDCGTEHDEELRLADVKPASKEMMEAQRDGDWPWDPNLWMENWPEVRDWRAPPKPPEVEYIASKLGPWKVDRHPDWIRLTLDRSHQDLLAIHINRYSGSCHFSKGGLGLDRDVKIQVQGDEKMMEDAIGWATRFLA